jgi:hypothetical protein
MAMRSANRTAMLLMKQLLEFWKGHKVAASAFVVALMVALFFAGRLAYFLVYWSDPAHQNQPIADWMTVGYVARSYDVPRDKLAQAIGVTPRPGQRRTLVEIAAERGVDTGTLKSELQQAIDRLRAQPEGND